MSNDRTGTIWLDGLKNILGVREDGGALMLGASTTLLTTSLSNVAGEFDQFVPAAGKVLTLSNTLTLAGTDATTMTFPSTTATVARTDAAQTFTGEQTFGNIVIGSANTLAWSTDLFLQRDAANTFAQRNGTSAQSYQIYNTFTDASNYERLFIGWSSNVALITLAIAGTGSARDLTIGTPGATQLNFRTNGTNRWAIGIGASAGFFIPQADNAYDFGAAGNQIKSLYAGTSVVTALLSSTGGVNSSSATAGIGYTTGAGGTVTQATSRSTGVTLSKTTGQITTTADSLAGLAIVTFTVTNTTVAATDTVIASKVSGDADTFCWVSAVAGGSFNVTLRNSHAVDADTTAFVFNFAVIKGVTS